MPQDIHANATVKEAERLSRQNLEEDRRTRAEQEKAQREAKFEAAMEKRKLAMAAAQARVNANARKQKERLQRGGYSAGLALVCFLVPVLGFVIAAISLSSPSEDTRTVGRQYLGWSFGGFVVGGIITLAVLSSS